MEYKVHGHKINVEDQECGIYKSPNPLARMEYAVLDTRTVFLTLNSLSLEKAVESVMALRDIATEQARWQNTPQNFAFPILIQTPGPSFSIEEVRGNIQNTEKFCNTILSALKGK